MAENQNTENMEQEIPAQAEAPVEAKPTMRQQLRERFKKDYPEDDYETDDDGERLGGRIMSRLDENDKRLQHYRENDDKLKEMFTANPATARFFTRWGAGDDPVNLLAEVFGDKLKETVESPDAEERMKTGLQKYFDGIKKSNEADAEFQKNRDATLAMLDDDEANGGNYEENQKALDLLTQICVDMAVGKVSKETLKMAKNALNYDSNIKNAREEGIATGRNERYQEKLRQRAKGDGQPASGSGESQRKSPDVQMTSQERMGRRSAWDTEERRETW